MPRHGSARSCCSRSALILLVLSKVHAITKNGLTMAYAPHEEGLMRANARLGRLAAIGAVIAAPIAFVFLKVLGVGGSDLPGRRRLRRVRAC